MSAVKILCLISAYLGVVLCSTDSEQFVLDVDNSVMTTFSSTVSKVRHMEKYNYTGQRSYILISDNTLAALDEGSHYPRNLLPPLFGVKGFIVTKQGKAIIVEHYRHCLYAWDKHWGLSAFAGRCGHSGDSDGTPGLFHHPHSIIQDSQNKSLFLLTDTSNNKIRWVSRITSQVYTFIQYITSPTGITQDSITGDLFVTSTSKVLYINYKDKSVHHLAGTYNGHLDGSFVEARFDNLKDILLINNRQMLVVADNANNQIRLLNLLTKTTNSICTGIIRSSDGGSDNCEIDHPWALMVDGDTLYIGTNSGLRRIAGKQYVKPSAPTPQPTRPFTTTLRRTTTLTTIMPTTAGPTTNKPTTTMPTTTKPSTTKPTTTIPTTAKPTTATSTPTTTTPTITTSTTTTPTTTKTKPSTIPSTTTQVTKCRAAITVLSSPATGLGLVNLASDKEVPQILQLPTGQYNFSTNGGKCSTLIRVIDFHLRRRLAFRAHYSVKCSQITDPVTRTTLQSLANSNYNEIEAVCKQDCDRETGADAALQCDGDILTIVWYTDLQFTGDVDVIPADLHHILTSKLNAMVSGFLKVVVFNRDPPVVYPTQTKDGLPAEIYLSSICMDNKIYNQKSDKCE